MATEITTEKLNATVPGDILLVVRAIAEKEDRSVSKIVSNLLKEAITARLELAKSLPN